MSGCCRLVAAVACATALVACTSQSPAAPPVPTVNAEAVRAESAPPPSDTVELTLYFRHGRGVDAYLTPRTRRVKLASAKPRRALELLLRGPGRSDEARVQPALPRTTEVRDFSVANGVANVTLSPHAVTDARTVGRRPEHEALALAAIANTLTEFPEVQRVRLRVEGDSGRRFWGFWGLPASLVRDPSVIDAKDVTRVVPPVDQFSHSPQRVGVRHRHRQPAIAAVRAKSFATYARLTVEVTAPRGTDLRGPVPPSNARHLSRGRVRLQVQGRPSSAVAGNIKNALGDPTFAGAHVRVRGKPHRIVLTLQSRDRKRHPFYLHALSEPARVVLDIRR